MATVIIPTPLRKFTHQEGRIQVDGDTVGEIIEKITQQFPDLKKHLLEPEGTLRSFINVFSGDEDIRDLQAEKTKVQSSTVISIVPAIAGGVF